MKIKNRVYNPFLLCRVLVYTSSSIENSRTLQVHKAHEWVLLKANIYYLQAIKSLQNAPYSDIEKSCSVNTHTWETA